MQATTNTKAQMDRACDSCSVQARKWVVHYHYQCSKLSKKPTTWPLACRLLLNALCRESAPSRGIALLSENSSARLHAPLQLVSNANEYSGDCKQVCRSDQATAVAGSRWIASILEGNQESAKSLLTWVLFAPVFLSKRFRRVETCDGSQCVKPTFG